MDHVRTDTVPLQESSHTIDQGPLDQLCRRQIYRNRDCQPLARPIGNLLACSINNPVSDLNNQAKLFGQRNKPVRCHHAVARTIPANQCLYTDGLTIAGRYFGLVVKFKLIGRERRTQVPLQIQSLTDRSSQRG